MTRKFSPVELLRIRQALNRREFEQRKNQREQKAEIQNSSATWIGKDANDGRPVVRLSTGKEVKGIGVITNGALVPGQPCNYRNGWVSGMPFRKRKEEVAVKKSTTSAGKIRWYYNGEVGGVSSIPVRLANVPPYPSAFKNLGASGWILDIVDNSPDTPSFTTVRSIDADQLESSLAGGFDRFTSTLGGGNVYQYPGLVLEGSTALYLLNEQQIFAPRNVSISGDITTLTYDSYLLPDVFYASTIVSNASPGSLSVSFDAMLPMRISPNGLYAIAQKYTSTYLGATLLSLGVTGRYPMTIGNGATTGIFNVPGEAIYVDSNGYYSTGKQWTDVFLPSDFGLPIAFSFEQYGVSIDVQNDGTITYINKTQFRDQAGKVSATVKRYSNTFSLMEEFQADVYLPESYPPANNAAISLMLMSYNDEEGS